MGEFRKLVRAKMAMLKMDESIASRYVNEGFSGGEKKRLEMLQMAVLEPEMAILDETDSGLDIDALRIVAEGVNAMLNPNMGVVVITHYQRLLDYITPDVVHVLAAGRIITSGGKDLALRLEDEGYAPILAENGLEGAVGDEAPLGRRRPRQRWGPPTRRDETDGRPRNHRAEEPGSACPTRSLPSPGGLPAPGDRQTASAKPIVYLDSAATSLKPLSVIEAVDGYNREYSANIHAASTRWRSAPPAPMRERAPRSLA